MLPKIAGKLPANEALHRFHSAACGVLDGQADGLTILEAAQLAKLAITVVNKIASWRASHLARVED